MSTHKIVSYLMEKQNVVISAMVTIVFGETSGHVNSKKDRSVVQREKSCPIICLPSQDVLRIQREVSLPKTKYLQEYFKWGITFPINQGTYMTEQQ